MVLISVDVDVALVVLSGTLFVAECVCEHIIYVNVHVYVI